MSIVLSKLLLVFEGLVLAVPVAYWGILVLPAALLSVVRSAAAFVACLIAIAMVLFIFAAYRVMLRFVVGGTQGLRHMSRIWWWLCALGATFTIGAALLLAIARPRLPISNDVSFMLSCGAYGVPFLVPYAHVAIENWLREADVHAI